ncbi:MAG TPA: glucose-6-phosphate isomerase, partial [Stellaceae bacterium]|nr:glucose-6-phosphate isomerase [Stellaceae bacterium]
MTYRQDIAGCLAETVGQRGVTAGELDAMLPRAKPALATLNRRRDEGSLPLLRLPARRDDLAA